ncbi:hypothetical protein M405DRAFT_815236 [Rhizopogon salebrosus TDB-379]|nr:hypothetical protein M405DRAFT_815236 [Rhizopogon salebrosus TDB-379]
MACTQANWSLNTAGQSPCVVVQLVDNACKNTYDTITPPSSENSFVPAGSNVTTCTCSWASYNLLSACMFCASGSPTLVSWDQWIVNCGNMTSTTYFPPETASNLSIPYYASYNPNNYTNRTFSETVAVGFANAGFPELNGNPISSSSGSSSSSSTTPVGAIAGGVVGGVILLFLFCGFFLFLFCRRRKGAARLSEQLTQHTWNGYPQTSAQPSTSPYSPLGMPGVPSTTSLRSLRVASPTSAGHAMHLSHLSPSVLPMSPPINDAADVITPFLTTQSPSQPSTSRNEKSAQVTPETVPERATSPLSQRSRMNPPPYTTSSPPSSHARTGSSASRRISIRRPFRQGGGSGDTTISSVIGNKKRPHAHRMRTDGSVDSTGSMASTLTASDSGAVRSFRTTLERTTTSADSSSRGPSV